MYKLESRYYFPVKRRVSSNMTFAETVIQIDDRLECDRIEVDAIIVKVLSYSYYYSLGANTYCPRLSLRVTPPSLIKSKRLTIYCQGTPLARSPFYKNFDLNRFNFPCVDHVKPWQIQIIDAHGRENFNRWKFVDYRSIFSISRRINMTSWYPDAGFKGKFVCWKKVKGISSNIFKLTNAFTTKSWLRFWFNSKIDTKKALIL